MLNLNGPDLIVVVIGLSPAVAISSARIIIAPAPASDGAYMPVRDKGPLFIVYPYDSDPALKHQVYYSRSAWQVARMVVS